MADRKTMVDPLPVIPAKYVREWLRYDEREQPDNRPKIRTSYTSRSCSDPEKADCAITIENLTRAELAAIEASILRGSSYIRGINGRLHAWDAYEPLPEPERDPVFFVLDEPPRHEGDRIQIQGEHFPAITVEAAGIGDPRNDPDRSRRVLKGWGFERYTTARRQDGSYHAFWHLPYISMAEGTLADQFEQIKEATKELSIGVRWQARTEQLCEFIAERITFGSLDATYQRWCLTTPD